MWTDDTAMAVSIVESSRRAASDRSSALAAAFARRYNVEPARGYGGGAHKVLDAIARRAVRDRGAPAVRRPGLVRQRRRHALGADRRVLLR